MKKTFSSHSGWVSSVSWHPTNAHLLISGSYDNTLKLWDMRAAVALATVTSHTDKVLCVEVDRAEKVFSGGADCKLRVHTLLVA